MGFCLVFRGLKRASGPLELELEMVVTCCMWAGNQTTTLCNSRKCL